MLRLINGLGSVIYGELGIYVDILGKTSEYFDFLIDFLSWLAS